MKKAVGEERYSPAVVLRKYSIYLVSIGTPVSNSMTELYIMQRYLRPSLLENAGLQTFDDWASNFGEVVSKAELKPAGAERTQRNIRKSNCKAIHNQSIIPTNL